MLQSGQSGDGCVSGAILCKYVYSSGDLFVRSCASVRLMWCVSVCSDLWMSGAGVLITLLCGVFWMCW